MKHEQKMEVTQLKAVIYCRVSSTKQKLDGGGLESRDQCIRDAPGKA